MDQRALGFLLAAIGGGLVVLGLLVASGVFSWFGRLPGDIRIEGERTRIFVPVVSMLVISAVLTVLLWLLRR